MNMFSVYKKQINNNILKSKKLQMGIRSLNKFLHVKCPGSIQNNIELKNVNIAIDAYIYMYKFLKEDMLYEGLYRMCNILKENNVSFVFVFDGKPPEEKSETLEERSIQREDALLRMNQLKMSIREESSPRKVVLMTREMEVMRKKSMRLKHSHIHNCKKLLNSHGVSYIQSVGEADNLCAYLSKKRIVDAVMSDDMDMFVYGVPRVIRNWDLNNKCEIYDTSKVLSSLFLSHLDFQVLCILVGSDYNQKNTEKVETMFQIYHKWITYKHSNKIVNYSDFVIDCEYDIDKVNNTLSIFQRRPQFKHDMVVKGDINIPVLSKVMKKNNFIFADNCIPNECTPNECIEVKE